MDETLSERLAACYTAAVNDVMRAQGLRDFVLPHGIRSWTADAKVAGPAFTVRGHVDPAVAPHETYLGWTEFLSAAPAGSVVVCQPNDRSVAHMGELSAETLQKRGVKGYVVDGGCRDVAFIRRIGFPVWCRYATPSDIVGYWVPDALGKPIAIGGVTIATGDYVLADADGVIVLARALAEDIVARTEEVMRTENSVRQAILGGMDPKEAYLKYRKF
jgi:regulator of RNase E activity RraA